MNTIEEFFKNRLSFNVKNEYSADNIFFGVNCLYDEFKYFSTIHNPQSLNIKDTFDLIEKLTPLLYYISSNIEKFIKEDIEYHPDCYFSITVGVDFSNSNYIYSIRTQKIGLFDCFYGIGGLTGDMNIFQKIKSMMEEEIQENPYNLLFNTNSFVVYVVHKNMWPYTEYFLETIDCKRMGNSQRLARYREIERREREEENEEESEKEERILNIEKTFKEDECVICLTNPPNVLFRNCGHIAICSKCNKKKSLENCPVCKTETTIKGTI